MDINHKCTRRACNYSFLWMLARVSDLACGGSTFILRPTLSTRLPDNKMRKKNFLRSCFTKCWGTNFCRAKLPLVTTTKLVASRRGELAEPAARTLNNSLLLFFYIGAARLRYSSGFAGIDFFLALIR